MEVTENKAEKAQGVQLEDGINMDSRDVWNLDYIPVCIKLTWGVEGQDDIQHPSPSSTGTWLLN